MRRLLTTMCVLSAVLAVGAADSSPSGGYFTAAELAASSITVPPWTGTSTDCPAGAAVRPDQHRAPEVDVVGSVVAEDSGQPISVALLSCGRGSQVVAYRRARNQRPIFAGQVLQNSGLDPAGQKIARIWQIRSGANGTIWAEVGDYDDWGSRQVDQHQWRNYLIRHGHGQQIGGPTSFPPNPHVTDLTVAAPTVVMSRQTNGQWTGTLVIRVTNRGPRPTHELWLDILTGFTDSVEQVCPPLGKSGSELCQWSQPLAPGDSKTVTIPLTAKDTTSTNDIGLTVSDGFSYPDLRPDDNYVAVKVKYRKPGR